MTWIMYLGSATYRAFKVHKPIFDMRVFISWSGPRSGAVAQILRDWLQDVIQALDPWMSDADIEKGARWSSVISAELEKSNFGIICLTRDNILAPWLLFEAGALSKLQSGSRVCTFLLDLKPSEVPQPLGQFQSTTIKRDDVLRLIQTINAACDDAALESNKLTRAFNRTWDELNNSLKQIAKEKARNPSAEDPQTILNEILGYVRSLSRSVSDGTSDDKKPPPLNTAEIVTLGKIFTMNKHLSITRLTDSRIVLEDGTHGTEYKINRRFLSKFLKKLRADARHSSTD